MDNGLLPIQLTISNIAEAGKETARHEQKLDCTMHRDWILTKSALLSRTAVQWSVSKINLNFTCSRDPAAAQDNGVKNVKLFGKNQWFIQVHEDGKVTGTREQCDPGGLFPQMNIQSPSFLVNCIACEGNALTLVFPQ